MLTQVEQGMTTRIVTSATERSSVTSTYTLDQAPFLIQSVVGDQVHRHSSILAAPIVAAVVKLRAAQEPLSLGWPVFWLLLCLYNVFFCSKLI